jgi:hypothetical protein
MKHILKKASITVHTLKIFTTLSIIQKQYLTTHSWKSNRWIRQDGELHRVRAADETGLFAYSVLQQAIEPTVGRGSRRKRERE